MRPKPTLESVLHDPGETPWGVIRYKWEDGACWDRRQAIDRLGPIFAAEFARLLEGYSSPNAPNVEIVIRVSPCLPR